MKLDLGVKTRVEKQLLHVEKRISPQFGFVLAAVCEELTLLMWFFCFQLFTFLLAVKKQPPSVEDEEKIRSHRAAEGINWEQDGWKILQKFQSGHMHLLTTDNGYSSRPLKEPFG